jgi:wyosine [tRNA(Phe)-imidazoG37] synthetase (radical SAM superfamily)
LILVTVVGEGEPTLATNLGELIIELKKLTDKPVAVITNGALLSDPQVREELLEADMVLPSLDAYDDESAKKIDRPYGTIRFQEEYEGLVEFTKMYQGQLWMEIMLVDGINDDDESIARFKELLKNLTYDCL